MNSGTSNKDIENKTQNSELITTNEIINESLKEKNDISFKKYLSNNSGYIKLTEDGLILKKICLKGFGKSNPLNGEEVFVNYIAELEDGRSVDNTLILREPKQIMMGKNNCIPGLELGIKSMIIGEKAKIIVFPEYGYLLHEYISEKNKEGNQNETFLINNLENLNLTEIKYPSIEDFKKMEVKELKKYLPIIYDIELVKIDKPRKNREYADVTEKMTEATDLKSEGNQLFRENRYREALIKYTTGLNYFFKIPTDDLITNKLIDLKQTLILNIINCHIALNEFNYALKRLLEAFEIKDTPKCYFYRCLSSMNLGDFDQAQRDLDKLKILLPNDKQILGLEENLKKFKEKTIADKKNIFKKGLFSQSSDNNINTNNDKSLEKNILPMFDEKNYCFYLDLLLNNNSKIPQKIKFEIFNLFSQTKLIDKSDNNLIKYLNEIIKEKKLIEKELEIIYLNENSQTFIFKIHEIEMNKENELTDINRFLNMGKDNNMKKYPPCEDALLALRKNDYSNYDLIILPNKLGNDAREDMFIIGRLFYNKEIFINISNKIKQKDKIDIKIIDCDRSFNY